MARCCVLLSGGQAWPSRGRLAKEAQKGADHVVNSVIEKDVTVEGNVTSSKGQCRSPRAGWSEICLPSLLRYTSGGIVEGALNAQSVAVEGTYNGQIKCDDPAPCAPARHVRADVSAKTMSTENGAQLQGNVKVEGKGVASAYFTALVIFRSAGVARTARLHPAQPAVSSCAAAGCPPSSCQSVLRSSSFSLPLQSFQGRPCSAITST